ncbi:MAG: pit accessory protein, partial [Verrucomicrobia bacterium]|nr:pit accessory protein [Verrucomicrobiota bacterium]
MISFQRLLGREDEFCGLLESSIARGVASVDALREMLAHRATVVTLHAFADARSKNKAATDEIRQRLITTFVTP